MMIRAIQFDELPALLRLYGFLNPEDPAMNPVQAEVQEHWRNIFDHPLFHYFVVESAGAIVSTCALSVIPNMTRGLRSYGLIENVVTDPDFRKKGFGTAVVRHALNEAWVAGCYKVMVQSGRTDPEVLGFYETAGFQAGLKTGFVAYRV